MNDRFHPAPTAAAAPLAAVLPVGARLGGFEIREVISRGANAVVYLATDHLLAMPVAIQEYLPARLVQRDSEHHLSAIDSWQDDVVARGLRAFVDDARLLAPLDHPSLLRVNQLFEAHGTAYRVMPLCAGQRLSDLRQQMVGAPDEAALRALLDGLLGALETVHRTGLVHGGVSPENILLLDDDRPLLLGPGSATRALGNDLVASLMATLDSASAAPGSTAAAEAATSAAPTGVARDLGDLAQTVRFCITAEVPVPNGAFRPREPLVDAIGREFPADRRPHYSAALTAALDAAIATDPQRRPQSVAEFRAWLAQGVPVGAPVPMPVPKSTATTTPAAAPKPLAGKSASAPNSAPNPAPTSAPAPELTPPPAVAAAAAADTAAAVPIDRIEPWTPLPEALAARNEPFGDPLPMDRAPRLLAPAAPVRRARAAAPRRGYYKALLAGALSVLALAIVVIAAGNWNPMPALALDPPVVERLATTAPVPPDIARTRPLPLPVPTPSTASPAPAPRTAEPPRSEAATAARSEAPAAARSETPAAAPADGASDPTATAAADPPADAPPARTARTVIALASTAPPRPAAEPAKALAAPARATTTAMPVLSAGSPRTACAGRTEFALYRCMQLQCKGAQWAAHPQCLKLRSTDEID